MRFSTVNNSFQEYMKYKNGHKNIATMQPGTNNNKLDKNQSMRI